MTGLVPGDIVALASGGPPLTVRVVQGSFVVVNWFSGSEIREAHFLPSQLFLLEFDGDGVPVAESGSGLPN